ncbi:MAG: hypothetical protein JSV36_11960 [Anaerolineae bacterium]|nr:MAG: hypothetical protein JSV36_11960 [Anaerolineae bacterium]
MHKQGFSTWGRMTDEMYAHMAHLSSFLADLPLAQVNLLPLDLATSDGTLKAWGLGGDDCGFFWVQDVSLAGAAVDQVREGVVVRSGATITVDELESGTYLIRPYDTWPGVRPLWRRDG